MNGSHIIHNADGGTIDSRSCHACLHPGKCCCWLVDVMLRLLLPVVLSLVYWW